VSSAAWPAAVVREFAGWRLRFHWGITQRSNSALADRLEGKIDLSARLRAVESFYQGWDGPARYQISPVSDPEGLDQELEARGYEKNPGASVQIAETSRVLALTRTAVAGRSVALDRVDPLWYQTYSGAENIVGQPAGLRHALLNLIQPPSIFVQVLDADDSAAVGIGILRSGWVGIFCMATHPEFRRRGHAAATVHALAVWARDQGAHRMFLQVVEANGPAIQLYARCGFEHQYAYHYRVRPFLHRDRIEG